jgi:hypothetical protein
MLEEQSKKQGRELTEEEKQSFAQFDKEAGKAAGKAGPLMGLGVFLIATAGTSIAGAVCLFRSKAAKFILVAAVLALVAEIMNGVIVRFGIGNALGFAGVVLAFFGARQIMAKGAADAAPPPAAAAPM